MPVTLLAESSTDTLPLASFCETAMKSFQVAMSLSMTALFHIQPVEPQSLQTLYSLPGSHA